MVYDIFEEVVGYVKNLRRLIFSAKCAVLEIICFFDKFGGLRWLSRDMFFFFMLIFVCILRYEIL